MSYRSKSRSIASMDTVDLPNKRDSKVIFYRGKGDPLKEMPYFIISQKGKKMGKHQTVILQCNVPYRGHPTNILQGGVTVNQIRVS